jgi:hypothetical protein
MAKLVEILARELKEWPAAVGGYGEHPSEAMAQDSDGCLVRLDHLAIANPGQFDGEDWSRVSWCGLGNYPGLADDYATAIVTRAEWQAAVDALNKSDAQRFAEDYVEANRDRHAKEWNGEGLPPVGTFCCFQHVHHGGAWYEGEILYISDEYTIIKGHPVGEQHYYTRNLEFRPIRTPEQIAADERESAINGMLTHDALGGSRRGLAAALYDAGYRKQEQK